MSKYKTPPPATFTHAQSRVFMMTFGKYAGQELGQIAATTEGLAYLDWLRQAEWIQAASRAHVKNALDAFLNDPEMIRAVAALMKGRD